MSAPRAADVGIVGLGTMGTALARNLARRGHRVAVRDRDAERARAKLAPYPEAAEAAIEAPPGDAAAFVGALARPRRILLLVPAGDAVDAVLDELDPLLEAGDVVVDGGNSHFADTDRRNARAATRPWQLVGMGVSGGAEGALHGPSLMPGGEPAAWETLRPLLESIAARSDAGPCVAWCGHGSAGHFVKMVHNGIEYAEMQHIAESVLLLRRSLGLSAAQAAEHFADWNSGELESFLVEITAEVLRRPDPEDPEHPLVDAILDRAEQKGTGRWTVQAALELGCAVPSIAAAVDARILSSDAALRGRADAAYGEAAREPARGLSAEDVRHALHAARLADHAQGFALLAAASRAHGYATDAAEVARIWRAGCIIRSRLLDDVRDALASGTPPGELVLAPAFRKAFEPRLAAWRRVVAAAAHTGLPAPALAASLAWLDTLSTARGSAALIQAQRDAFGRHGYERTDRPGTTLHTSWRERS